MKQTDIQNDNTRNTKSILNPIVRSSEPIELINSGNFIINIHYFEYVSNT